MERKSPLNNKKVTLQQVNVLRVAQDAVVLLEKTVKENERLQAENKRLRLVCALLEYTPPPKKKRASTKSTAKAACKI